MFILVLKTKAAARGKLKVAASILTPLPPEASI